MFLGLRSTIYPATDLPASKAWATAALGIEPYFDEPFYVGYRVGGYEFALDPNATEVVTYWGVADVGAALARLEGSGATVVDGVRDVGDGIRVATVALPHAMGVLGIIENPHFAVEPVADSSGPGR